MFSLMAEGGMWGVPRSGLMFQRRGEKLILISRMPWAEGMPISKNELVEQQEQDYEQIQHYFGLAGITVEREDED